jgi:hypothetical protein
MNDLHTTIFEVEIPPMDLFDAEEEGARVMQSRPSRESLNKHQPLPFTPHLSRTGVSPPLSPKVSDRVGPVSPGLRPRSRSRQRNPADVSTSDLLDSPLARIYTRRPLSVDVPERAAGVGETVDDILSSVRKVEHMVEGLNELPIGRLRAEMKELQVSHPSRFCCPN